jgi:hypothetical protein
MWWIVGRPDALRARVCLSSTYSPRQNLESLGLGEVKVEWWALVFFQQQARDQDGRDLPGDEQCQACRVDDRACRLLSSKLFGRG